jgi:radical SAM protein with 4Fe4S-binding SPASM domain
MIQAIEITTQIGCINCKYCPQEKLIKSYNSDKKTFDFIDFKTCIDKIPDNIAIHFSGFSEPFLHSNISGLIRYCLPRDIVVYTSLSGITEETIEKIKDIKFKKFLVHFPDDSTPYNNKLFYDRLKLLYKHNITVGFAFVGANAAIYNSNIEVTQIISRAGNAFTRYRLPGKIQCSRNKIEQPVLLPDGNLYLCCMDYGLQHNIGNLLKQNWQQIEESENLKFAYIALENEELTSICRYCEYAE